MREPSSFPPVSVPLNQQALIQNGDIAPQTLVACEECDTLYHRIQLTQGERAYCLCCGAELYRQSKPFSVLLAMVTTALIVFVI
ncbi:MAG: paraquat-inducible protein A, partial [Pseudomonadota bacterium]